MTITNICNRPRALSMNELINTKKLLRKDRLIVESKMNTVICEERLSLEIAMSTEYIFFFLNRMNQSFYQR